jgi:hypothetical protein
VKRSRFGGIYHGNFQRDINKRIGQAGIIVEGKRNHDLTMDQMMCGLEN